MFPILDRSRSGVCVCFEIRVNFWLSDNPRQDIELRSSLRIIQKVGVLEIDS
jgi:hypothetical protein